MLEEKKEEICRTTSVQSYAEIRLVFNLQDTKLLCWERMMSSSGTEAY